MYVFGFRGQILGSYFFSFQDFFFVRPLKDPLSLARIISYLISRLVVCVRELIVQFKLCLTNLPEVSSNRLKHLLSSLHSHGSSFWRLGKGKVETNQ